jgi:hypothetical protein
MATETEMEAAAVVTMRTMEMVRSSRNGADWEIE